MSAYSQRQKTLSYSDFVNLYNNSELVKGVVYCIPYQAEHEIPNSGNTVHTSSTEHLCITALSSDKYNTNVQSVEYPEDTIKWTHEKLYKDGNNNTLSSYGTILYRKDNNRNIEAYEDFRNIKLRRYFNPNFTINGSNYFVNIDDTDDPSFEEYFMISDNDNVINVFVGSNYDTNKNPLVSNNLIRTDGTFTIENVNIEPLSIDNYITSLDSSNLNGTVKNISIKSSNDILVTSSDNVEVNFSSSIYIVSCSKTNLTDVNSQQISDTNELELFYYTGSGSSLSNLSNTFGVGSIQLENDSLSVKNLISEGFVRVGPTTDETAGNIRFDGSNFQGYDGSQWVNFGSTTANTDYTKNNGIKVSVGALQQGYVPSGTIQDLLDDMLYPFIDPTVSFSISPSLAEKGTTVNPVTLSWNINPNDDSVTQRTLKRGSTTLTNPTSNNGNYDDTSGIEFDSPDLTWNFEVSFNQTSNINRSKSINFVAPSYFGVGAAGLSESQIKSQLTQTLITDNNDSFTYNPSNERMYFVYPQSFGQINSVIDPNQFDITASFIETTATFTLADGTTTEPYYIYYNDQDTTQTNFTLTFS